MKAWLWPVGLLILAAAPAAADDDVRSKPLTLHPPAPAARALQYALLPELQDTTPGNAADHYRQAIKNMKQDAPPERDWYPALNEWMAAPLKDFPKNEAGRFLKQCESTFREAEAGAHCENCDWGLTEKLRQNGFKTLLQDFVDMRSIGALLNLRIRYELAEGRPDRAARTLQIGFVVSRHVADSPTFIGAVDGIALGNLMLERMEEVIQQPGAPGFYWPLTDLPRPFIDLRKPIQGERIMTYGSFPGAAEMAADLNAKPWTPEQAKNALAALKFLVDYQSRIEDAEMFLLTAARHEAAKKVLLDEGRPKELVDAMPHIQVALLVALRHCARCTTNS